MHAKMSEAPAVSRLAGMMFGAAHSAAQAEREVRAILAETEPSVSDGGAWHTWSLAGQGTETLALAESLRSFVGEPCHCAQGLHWSPERGYFHCAGVTPEA